MLARLATLLLMAGGLEFQEPFDYPDGAEAEPAWYAEALGWEVRDGAMLAECGPKGFLTLIKAPHGRSVEIEATLTVTRRTGTEWGVAGVAIRRDPRNHWHLALVETPAAHGHRHVVELQEMVDGRWPALGDAETRLEAVRFEGNTFDWQYGRPYRLRIEMTTEGVAGTVAELDGTVRTRIAYAFGQTKAVRAGQPALDGGGFEAIFDDVTAKVDDVVPAPNEPEREIPPYTLDGFDTMRGKATGFFHPERIDGRWWMVDPHGRGFYMVGTDHASYYVHWCERLGYAPYHKNMQARHGSEQAWADETADRLKRWGFNTLPANHSRHLRYRHFAHIEFLAWGSTFSPVDDIVPKTTWTGLPNVFSPTWERFCEKRARAQCAPNRGDPWLIGYFIDNELEWWGKIHREWGVFVEAWKKPADHSAKQAWLAFVKQHVKDIAAFNRQWGVNAPSFEALASHTQPGGPICDEAKDLARGFLRLVADRYFRIASEAIRRHDPDHLVLGCRFAGNAPDIWDIAGKYCDVVSLNTYPRIDVHRGVPESLVAFLKQCHATCGRPMMITEWSFPALDAGLPCKHGAGMRVDTQAQKTACFRHYQKLLFSLPFMIGSNYFMWADEPALGISKTFPEDSNYGLVNVEGKPYTLLTQACAALNPRACRLHRTGKVNVASPPKLVGWLVPRASGRAETPQADAVLELGDLTVRLRPTAEGDTPICRFELDAKPLGSLRCMLHQQGRGDVWAHADRAKVLGIRSNPDVHAVDIEFASGQPGQQGAPATDSPRAYRAGWRLLVPKRPVAVPFVASQCLWVENVDQRPFQLVEVFHWIAPTLGGSPEGDVAAGRNVPNYYVAGAGWVDPEAGLGIGVTYLSGKGYSCSYWRNPSGGFHSDMRLAVNETLRPGQRVALTAPPVFVFGFRQDGPNARSLAAVEILRAVIP